MTIKELIDILSQYQPDTPVVVRGYEAGFNDITNVEELSIQLNINTAWYYGAHGTTDARDEPVLDVPFSTVVYLHGTNQIANEDWHNR